MIFAVAFASLFALSAAAPPRLNISSTFLATGEVEWHRAEETLFGTIMFGRDHKSKLGIEEANFHFQGKDDVEKVLQLYNIQSSIYIRGPPSDLRCINQTRNGTLSPFWEWTMVAVYEGIVNIHERDCDLWSYAVADVRLEVILEQGDMSTPLYYNRKTAEEFVLIHIKSFSTEAPDPKLFTVPPACMLG